MLRPPRFRLKAGVRLSVRDPLFGAAGDGPDPGDEFPHSEGLDQIVVGTEFQGQHAVDLLVPGADDDDRGCGQRTDGPAHVGSVHIRQPEVQEHKIRAGVPDGVQGLAARGDMAGRESGPGQTFKDAGGN